MARLVLTIDRQKLLKSEQNGTGGGIKAVARRADGIRALSM